MYACSGADLGLGLELPRRLRLAGILPDSRLELPTGPGLHAEKWAGGSVDVCRPQTGWQQLLEQEKPPALSHCPKTVFLGPTFAPREQ